MHSINKVLYVPRVYRNIEERARERPGNKINGKTEKGRTMIIKGLTLLLPIMAFVYRKDEREIEKK